MELLLSLAVPLMLFAPLSAIMLTMHRSEQSGKFRYLKYMPLSMALTFAGWSCLISYPAVGSFLSLVVGLVMSIGAYYGTRNILWKNEGMFTSDTVTLPQEWTMDNISNLGGAHEQTQQQRRNPPPPEMV